ncbi:MAG: histidinol dehydrogenase [Anaerolineales bacterium]|nr:histidinol dehydrogenase [Anaerolineales bacterium]
MIEIIEDLQVAKRTILHRSQKPTDYPDHVLSGVARIFGDGVSPEDAVARILSDVRDNGDVALRSWSERIDGIVPDPFQVTQNDLSAGREFISAETIRAMELALDRIRTFHSLQPLSDWETKELGGIMGQRMIPLERVGVYVPSGTASLPSSLLMAAIPAKVAGVQEIIVCSPPGKEGNQVAGVILAAAHMLGIEKVYQLGGAQAIAAMAYGTETVPRVDKIVGPGNIFVTLAKQQVFGQVGIDGLFGPTETVIVADEAANPEWVAADLLAQAEHDVLATAILITPSLQLAQLVKAAITDKIVTLKRKKIMQQSLIDRGGIVIVPDIKSAVSIADEYAPEHLCLYLDDADQWSNSVQNAGCLFIGQYSCEVMVDYVAGPNHILPTGGTARFSSPLNVLDFIKIMSVVTLDQKTSNSLIEPAARIALAESLDAHALAALERKP